MTEAVLAGDRRIGMVAVLPSQIASMHGNPATISIGCAGIIEDHQLLPGGRYNIVLLSTERFRIRRELPLTAIRSYRIAEVEFLEEADDPEDSAGFVQQRARLMGLFSELINWLENIGDQVIAHHSGEPTCTPDSLEEIDNAVLTQSIANTFHLTSVEKQGLLEENGHCARFERLSALLGFALAERHRGRVPHLGFLQRFFEVSEKSRYLE